MGALRRRKHAAAARPTGAALESAPGRASSLPDDSGTGACLSRGARPAGAVSRSRGWSGLPPQPVHIEGRTIARSFWGRRWCHHLESCSDFENRLPRGRAYVRNGSVCHLDVHAGGVDAMVVGSDLYHVVVRIRKLGQVAWKTIRAECAGRPSGDR